MKNSTKKPIVSHRKNNETKIIVKVMEFKTKQS